MIVEGSKLLQEQMFIQIIDMNFDWIGMHFEPTFNEDRPTLQFSKTVFFLNFCYKSRQHG